jgi:hypothetical protein
VDTKEVHFFIPLHLYVYVYAGLASKLWGKMTLEGIIFLLKDRPMRFHQTTVLSRDCSQKPQCILKFGFKFAEKSEI